MYCPLQEDSKDFKRYVNKLEWHVGIIEIDSYQNFWLIYIYNFWHQYMWLYEISFVDCCDYIWKKMVTYH